MYHIIFYLTYTICYRNNRNKFYTTRSYKMSSSQEQKTGSIAVLKRFMFGFNLL